MRIAYVVSRWGEPTQTFVRREARSVTAIGGEVVAFSLKPPVSVASGSPVVHLTFIRVLHGVARAVRQSPARTLKIWLDVILHTRPRTLLSQIAAASIGIAWVGSGAWCDAGVMSAHTHFGWVAATASWAAARLKRHPYTVVLHAFDIHDRRVADRLRLLTLREAGQVFCISQRDAAMVRDRWGIDAAVLRMGVPDEWLEERTEARDERLVVSVGSLVPKKGHDVLITALSSMRDVRAVIVGRGPLRKDLEQAVRELGVADRVTLAGAMSEEDVRTLMARAALCCLACRPTASGDQDGIPVALMEAMAVGTPVISTRVGAIEELVEGAGILVDPEDAEALTTAIEYLLNDNLEWARLALEGRRRIKAGWTSSHWAKVVLDAHRQLLAGRRVCSAAHYRPPFGKRGTT